MTHMLAFDLESTFRAIIARMEEESAFDREAYHDLVEEFLEEKREAAELSDDDDIQEYIEQLRARWPEAQELLQVSHDQGMLE